MGGGYLRSLRGQDQDWPAGARRVWLFSGEITSRLFPETAPVNPGLGRCWVAEGHHSPQTLMEAILKMEEVPPLPPRLDQVRKWLSLPDLADKLREALTYALSLDAVQRIWVVFDDQLGPDTVYRVVERDTEGAAPMTVVEA